MTGAHHSQAPQCDGSGVIAEYDEGGTTAHDCPGCCMCDAATDESEIHFALTTLQRLRPPFLSAAARDFLTPGVLHG